MCVSVCAYYHIKCDCACVHTHAHNYVCVCKCVHVCVYVCAYTCVTVSPCVKVSLTFTDLSIHTQTPTQIMNDPNSDIHYLHLKEAGDLACQHHLQLLGSQVLTSFGHLLHVLKNSGLVCTSSLILCICS